MTAIRFGFPTASCRRPKPSSELRRSRKSINEPKCSSRPPRRWVGIHPIPQTLKNPEGNLTFLHSRKYMLPDRGEKPRGIEEGSRPSGRLAGETACPTASIRFFMKFRGRNAHPNRVEKPPACRPVGKLKHTLPRAEGPFKQAAEDHRIESSAIASLPKIALIKSLPASPLHSESASDTKRR
jgi:hypothetical protein